MKKHWVIGTALLLLAGGAGSVGVLVDIAKEKKQTALYKARYGKGADEYVQQYLDWNKLPTDERVETPWGQGEYGGADIQQRLREQQPGRLIADLPDLAAALPPHAALADVLYGKNWRQTVQRYKKRTEARDTIAIASTVTLLAGLIVAAGYGAKLAFRKLKNSKKRPAPMTTETTPESPQQAEDAQTENDIVSTIIQGDPTDDTAEAQKPAEAPKVGLKTESIGYFQNLDLHHGGVKTGELKQALRDQASSLAVRETQNQADQLTEKVATLMSTAPVSQDLTELTQEVSAIRQFAAEQQDRVRQLQDGYDWGIIKRFCIRVIRCIDNLDEKLAKISAAGADPLGLEDVRDELIFSLESSGVEQYEPEINSSYKGLEKLAEAVKGRIPIEDPGLVGAVAEIVRPGYQYVVNEDDVKIVRCAQVKLYGETS